MEWMEHLFLGESLTEPEKAVAALRRAQAVPRLYCIVFFADRKRLEILPSRQLLHPRNRKRPSKIVGLAMGRGEALVLLAFMAQTAWEEGKNPAAPQDWIDGWDA